MFKHIFFVGLHDVFYLRLVYVLFFSSCFPVFVQKLFCPKDFSKVVSDRLEICDGSHRGYTGSKLKKRDGC